MPEGAFDMRVPVLGVLRMECVTFRNAHQGLGNCPGRLVCFKAKLPVEFRPDTRRALLVAPKMHKVVGLGIQDNHNAE